MRRIQSIRSFVVFCALSSIFPLTTRADGLSADEQAFFDKHSGDVVSVVPTKLTDPSLLKVFAQPFYDLKVTIKQPDGEMSNDVIATRVGDKLVCVMRPGTDSDLSDFPAMLRTDFKLKSDDDAKTLQQALDAAYPIVGSDDDKKAEAFTHSGNHWNFVRGLFFKDKLGFSFETGDDGSIKSVKFVLKLPAT